MRFWLLPFLLAITLGCVSEAHSSAQAFADDGFIGLFSPLHQSKGETKKGDLQGYRVNKNLPSKSKGT
jgi:hypothetical protein